MKFYYVRVGIETLEGIAHVSHYYEMHTWNSFYVVTTKWFAGSIKKQIKKQYKCLAVRVNEIEVCNYTKDTNGKLYTLHISPLNTSSLCMAKHIPIYIYIPQKDDVNIYLNKYKLRYDIFDVQVHEQIPLRKM